MTKILTLYVGGCLHGIYLQTYESITTALCTSYEDIYDWPPPTRHSYSKYEYCFKEQKEKPPLKIMLINGCPKAKADTVIKNLLALKKIRI